MPLGIQRRVEELNPDLDLPQHLLPRAIETFLQLLFRVAGAIVAALDIVLDDLGQRPPGADQGARIAVKPDILISH